MILDGNLHVLIGLYSTILIEQTRQKVLQIKSHLLEVYG